MPIYRNKNREGYTILDDAILHDDLSLEALGVLWLALSLPDDWKFSKAGLAKMAHVSTWRIEKITKELKAKGYLRLDKIETPKGFKYEWNFFESPQSVNSQTWESQT